MIVRHVLVPRKQERSEAILRFFRVFFMMLLFVVMPKPELDFASHKNETYPLITRRLTFRTNNNTDRLIWFC